MAQTPGQQLAAFIAKFDPGVAACARGCVAKMRKRFPGAKVLVYDNYNALAIGFCGNERATDITFSLAIYPRWVSLFLMHGPRLVDPLGMLKGGGSRVRHIVLDGPQTLDLAAVKNLLRQAVKLSAAPLPATGKGEVIIKSISAKQRPRRSA